MRGSELHCVEACDLGQIRFWEWEGFFYFVGERAGVSVGGQSSTLSLSAGSITQFQLPACGINRL